MIENKDTETVALIPIKYQLADCLTKWAASTKSSSDHHYSNVPIKHQFLEEEDQMTKSSII